MAHSIRATKSFFALCVLLACGTSCGESERGSAPNIILISMDTCRADSMGFMGAERKTPALDSMASTALVFEDCLSQSSVTAPSHMSLFTGQTVQRHGLLRNGDATTPLFSIASCLRDAGYATAAFTGHGSLQEIFGHAYGFEVFTSLSPTQDPGEVFQRKFEDSVPESLAWLDGRNKNKPFFLLVHGYDPHLPYWPEEPKRSEYGGWYEGTLDLEDLRRRAVFMPLIEAGRIGPDERKLLRDLYDAEILEADEMLAIFFDGLRERGLMENSIIIFTSDHGELLGEHDWVGHGPLYEEVIHVPLFIRFPGALHAGRTDLQVQHIDLMPTILNLANFGQGGVPVPAGVQGIDLMAVIEKRTEIAPGRLRISRRGPDVAITTSDNPNVRILLRHRDGGTGVLNVLAFDLDSDPEQTTNARAQNKMRDRVGQICASYLDWKTQAEAEDPLYQTEVHSFDEEQDMLRALGYAGDELDAED